MKKLFLVIILISSLILSSCAKEFTPEEIEFLECSKEAKKVVPSTLTLEFDKNPFSDDTKYILKQVRWVDGERSLTDRAFQKRITSNDKRYFALKNDNKVESSWFYTEPIYYDKAKNGSKIGIQAEYEFILTPTDAITYEEIYNDLTHTLEEDKERGRRIFDVDEVIVDKCKFIRE